MGEVYRARDPRLAREVAIKVLPGASDAERLQRFEQEARAAAALSHPNILAVYDVGTHDGAPYILSEALEGATLRDLLNGGSIAPKKCVEYAVQVCQGLAAAHEKGIVHRDLKPENLFITIDGRAKILDFGLAKLSEAVPAAGDGSALPTRGAGTRPGVVMGTVGCMSPEQVRGEAVDALSDIFSFGAILLRPALPRGSALRTNPKSTANADSVDAEIPLAVVKTRLVPGEVRERPTPKNQ